MGVYLEMARKNIRAQLEYNYSTYLLIIGRTFAQMTFILGFILIFRSFGSIKGYTFGEILLIYSAVNISYAIGEILSKGIGNMSDYIKRGTLDIYLLRPRSLLLQVLGSGIEISRVGRLSQSVLLLIYTLVTVNIGWTLPKAFAYILAVGAGIILMLSVYIINGGLTFFFINGIEISILFNGSGSDTLHYPADVIPGRLKYIFFTVFPFAAVNYYPFRYILGRTDEIRMKYGIFSFPSFPL